jgi:hypothetical protein
MALRATWKRMKMRRRTNTRAIFGYFHLRYYSTGDIPEPRDQQNSEICVHSRASSTSVVSGRHRGARPTGNIMQPPAQSRLGRTRFLSSVFKDLRLTAGGVVSASDHRTRKRRLAAPSNRTEFADRDALGAHGCGDAASEGRRIEHSPQLHQVGFCRVKRRPSESKGHSLACGERSGRCYSANR